MKGLRLGFADFGMSKEWFTEVLSQRYNVIRDDENPQVLVFGDENFGNSNERYDPSRVLKIFHTGENRRFWDYKCHMGITFDHIDSNIHYRLPLYVFELWSLTREQGQPEFKQDKLDQPLDKTGFATFVNSNPNSEKRNQLVKMISEYKRVDCGGPLFNNVGGVIPRPTPAKIDFARTRKFHLAFENSSYAGYVTEKILHGFYARSVPIYWGSPTVAMDFNPEAFINWHDYKDDKKFMERIIEVDNNDELYYHMLNQPPFKENKPDSCMNMDNLLDWWEVNVMGKFR
jgi:hypothetical protein